MRLRFAFFARVMGYWTLRADPDGAEDRARVQHEGVRFHLPHGFEGRWFAAGVFDPVAAPSSPTSSSASTSSSSKPTGPRSRRVWATAWAWVPWPAPRPGRRTDALTEMAACSPGPQASQAAKSVSLVYTAALQGVR